MPTNLDPAFARRHAARRGHQWKCQTAWSAVSWWLL